MMSTSGKARKSFATRVIRANRSNRTSRRIVASPMPSPVVFSENVWLILTLTNLIRLMIPDVLIISLGSK